jgi:mRNA-degrading endonuclease toxin of MazEF toxin-antitoxin module
MSGIAGRASPGFSPDPAPPSKSLSKPPDAIQADDLLAPSTIVVCPTSTSTPQASFHPEIEINEQTTLEMCEMVGAVESRSLGERVGHLTPDERRVVDDALDLILDLA